MKSVIGIGEYGISGNKYDTIEAVIETLNNMNLKIFKGGYWWWGKQDYRI